MLHVIHCIQSGCILPGCMESTTIHHAAWNPLHSIRMHFTRLHGVHCIQSHCMESTAFNRDAFYQAAWFRSIQSCCMDSTAFNHAAWIPRNSIGMHWALRHGLYCIQSCCINSPAFYRVPFLHAALNPLHSIMLQESTAFNHAA